MVKERERHGFVWGAFTDLSSSVFFLWRFWISVPLGGVGAILNACWKLFHSLLRPARCRARGRIRSYSQLNIGGSRKERSVNVQEHRPGNLFSKNKAWELQWFSSLGIVAVYEILSQHCLFWVHFFSLPCSKFPNKVFELFFVFSQLMNNIKNNHRKTIIMF